MKNHLPLICLTILLSFMATISRAGADPTVIGTITIDARDIFDQEELTDNNFVGAMANKLHVRTREKIIRRELLIAPGIPYDTELIAETERNLRRLHTIGDVSIHETVRDDGTVDLVVETHDKWTFNSGFSYNQEGGVRKLGAMIMENNFRGRAQSVYLSYTYRNDRRDPHGWLLGFSEPRLFGSRWWTNISLHESEELSSRSVALLRPFFAESTKWSCSGYLDSGRQTTKIYENGVISREPESRRQRQHLWAIRSFGKTRKLRLGLGWQARRRWSTETAPSTYDRLDLVNLTVGLLSRRFIQERHLENFGRVEDLPVGYSIQTTAGYNLSPDRAGRADYYLAGNLTVTTKPTGNWYLGFNLGAHGFRTDDRWAEVQVTGQVVQHWRLPGDQTLIARALGSHGSNWSPDRQMTLGASNGLRGFPTHRFDGQNLVVFNLEDRIFRNLDIWLLRIGGVVFWDCGTAWDDEPPIWDQRFHNAVGFGLRVENSKQSGPDVTRVEFAFNLDDRRFNQVIISSGYLFNSFLGLGTSAPVAR
jgi:hypothetical protein